MVGEAYILHSSLTVRFKQAAKKMAHIFLIRKAEEKDCETVTFCTILNPLQTPSIV